MKNSTWHIHKKAICGVTKEILSWSNVSHAKNLPYDIPKENYMEGFCMKSFDRVVF